MDKFEDNNNYLIKGFVITMLGDLKSKWYYFTDLATSKTTFILSSDVFGLNDSSASKKVKEHHIAIIFMMK